MTIHATNAATHCTTNESGRYNFSNVPPGKYNLTITKSGFRQAKFTDQQVDVGETRTIDIRLEIGASTETVEVMATNTELQTHECYDRKHNYRSCAVELCQVWGAT